MTDEEKLELDAGRAYIDKLEAERDYYRAAAIRLREEAKDHEAQHKAYIAHLDASRASADGHAAIFEQVWRDHIVQLERSLDVLQRLFDNMHARLNYVEEVAAHREQQ
jgi:hypothetical protein